MKRKILSLLAASTIFLSLGITVGAEDYSFDTEEVCTQTLRIGDYDCYAEDGQYYTVLDGETYLVVNLDELFYNPSECQTNSLSSSNDWTNNSEVSIVDTSYSGTVDISSGDDSTPIFVGRESGSARGFKIYAGFIFNNTYSVTVHLYNSIYSRWDENKLTLDFALGKQTKILYTGTMQEYYTKACVVFHKAGSTGETTVGYTVSEAT